METSGGLKMSKHISDEQAVAYHLDTLSLRQRSDIDDHCAGCVDCGRRLDLVLEERQAIATSLRKFAAAAQPSSASDWAVVSQRIAGNSNQNRRFDFNIGLAQFSGLAAALTLAVGLAVALAGIAFLPGVLESARGAIERAQPEFLKPALVSTATPTFPAIPPASNLLLNDDEISDEQDRPTLATVLPESSDEGRIEESELPSDSLATVPAAGAEADDFTNSNAESEEAQRVSPTPSPTIAGATGQPDGPDAPPQVPTLTPNAEPTGLPPTVQRPPRRPIKPTPGRRPGPSAEPPRGPRPSAEPPRRPRPSAEPPGRRRPSAEPPGRPPGGDPQRPRPGEPRPSPGHPGPGRPGQNRRSSDPGHPAVPADPTPPGP